MRRADRLFQIIQILRRSARPITAAVLAGELEVTVRTVYRDVADLIAQRVPIRGEAGVGYVLDRDYDMPPLMLSADELEAAVLGAQWVAKRGDPGLASAARDLLAKISGVVPDHLRPFIADPGVSAGPTRAASEDSFDIARLRDPCRVQGAHQLSRRGWPRERARRLAGDGRLRRDCPAARGMVRVAAGLPSLPHRPYRCC